MKLKRAEAQKMIREDLIKGGYIAVEFFKNREIAATFQGSSTPNYWSDIDFEVSRIKEERAEGL